MFIVFNRQKIFSYLVAFSTIVILFGIAFSVTNENAVITSSTVRELPIYNVKTDQKKYHSQLIVHGNNYFCDRK